MKTCTMWVLALGFACAALTGGAQAQATPAPDSAAAGNEGAGATDAAPQGPAGDTPQAIAPEASAPEASPPAAQPPPPKGEAGAPAATAEPPASEPPRPGSFPPGGFKGWWTQQRTAPPRPIAANEWLRDSCVDCSVPFTGDAWRARGPANWFKRTAADWLAMPSTVKTWGAPGWLTFGGFTAATVLPMVPMGASGKSIDVRLQNWIKKSRTKRSDRAFLHISTTQIVAGTIVWEGLILGAGWASGNERLLEYGGLTVETIADVQFFHLMSKMLLGREGPKDGNGNGRIHGPTEVFFPAGTPSGHTASIYALLTVSAEFADSWVLRAFSHVAALYFGASLIYNDAHFVSDVIWGAAMGYYMGRWIMRYRSSRYRCDDKRKLSLRERMMWMPVVNQHGIALGVNVRL